MPSGPRPRGARSGFTIIELLVVVGIILVLIGILLPVASKIRAKAAEADCKAQLTKLSTAIQYYFTQNNNTYPGPIPESYVWGYNTDSSTSYQSPSTPCVTGEMAITSTENLLLGLVGGLTIDPTSNIVFKPDLVTAGAGPKGLRKDAPQQFTSYIEVSKSELPFGPDGKLTSWTTATGYTTVVQGLDIPEILDHFANPHPIIYVRARAGAKFACDTTISPTSPTGSQYYSMELAPYWYVVDNLQDRNAKPNQNNAPFPSQYETPDDRTANNALWTAYTNTNGQAIDAANAFFQNQTIKDIYTPRSKDSFILISAGLDGFYGSKDDIIYSN